MTTTSSTDSDLATDGEASGGAANHGEATASPPGGDSRARRRFPRRRRARTGAESPAAGEHGEGDGADATVDEGPGTGTSDGDAAVTDVSSEAPARVPDAPPSPPADESPADKSPLRLLPPPDGSGLSHWKRVDADAAEWFDEEEIQQGRAYNRPIGRLNRVRQALGVIVLIALVVGEVAPRVLEALDLSGWVLELLAVLVLFEAVNLVYSPWFSAYRSLLYDRRWGQSTQTAGGLVLDEVKGTVVNLVLLSALLVPLYAVIRATDLWWLFGWLIFSGFTVLLGLLYPVVIAPIFNQFEPLGDKVLRDRLLTLARRLDLDVNEVLVTDASKRSVAGNAYVAGLGKTRRVVLFDTILDWSHDAIEQVVAHELGHWHHRHLRRKLPVLLAFQLVTFIATWAVLRSDALLEVAGVAQLGDPASLPLFLAVFPLSFVLTTLVSSWLSRVDERQADLFALGTLGDPQAFTELFRRVAERNKADVDPSCWKRITASHPPVAERLAMAGRWGGGRHNAP
ncbi:MAG: M48 family metallopeptidase [Acidimicrobiales bacterium]